MFAFIRIEPTGLPEVGESFRIGLTAKKSLPLLECNFSSQGVLYGFVSQNVFIPHLIELLFILSSSIWRSQNSIGLINEAIFFFNDTATTEIYTLSLHDALPI